MTLAWTIWDGGSAIEFLEEGLSVPYDVAVTWIVGCD